MRRERGLANSAASMERVEGLSPEDQRLYFETGRVPFRWPRFL